MFSNNPFSKKRLTASILSRTRSSSVTGASFMASSRKLLMLRRSIVVSGPMFTPSCTSIRGLILVPLRIGSLLSQCWRSSRRATSENCPLNAFAR